MRPMTTVAAIIMIVTVPGCAKSTVTEEQRRSAVMACIESLPPGLQTDRGWSAALETCDELAQAKLAASN
jgi:metal-sulfur cluster biosynthetic enzyme